MPLARVRRKAIRAAKPSVAPMKKVVGPETSSTASRKNSGSATAPPRM